MMVLLFYFDEMTKGYQLVPILDLFLVTNKFRRGTSLVLMKERLYVLNKLQQKVPHSYTNLDNVNSHTKNSKHTDSQTLELVAGELCRQTWFGDVTNLAVIHLRLPQDCIFCIPLTLSRQGVTVPLKRLFSN